MKTPIFAMLFVLAATSVAAQDSPLVAAAKAAKNPKRPSSGIVITNDNLVRVGGHLSTASAPAWLPDSGNQPATNATKPSPVPAVNTNAAAKANEAEAKKQQAIRDYSGESIEPRTDDPAAREHAMTQATSTAKPPQN